MLAPNWIKDNHEVVPVAAMSNAHIKNCINYLMSGRMGRTSCNGFNNQQWILIFSAEIKRRNRTS